MPLHPLLSVPNQFSILRILLSPVFYFLFFDNSLSGALACSLVFTIAALTDWLDGYIARKYGLITRWGKFLDPFADKVLTLTAFFAFYQADILPFWMLITIATRDILLTGYRIFQESKGHSIPANQIAKWKTASQLVAIIIVLITALYPRLFPGDAVLSPLFTTFLTSISMKLMLGLVTAYTVFSAIVYLIDDAAGKRNEQ